MRRIRPILLALGVLMISSLLLPSGTTEAQRVGDSTRIIAQHSNRCMDVRNKSKLNRAIVQQHTCKPRSAASNQRWTLVPAGQGYFYIVNRLSKRCLDIRGASGMSGAIVQQYTCKGSTNQQFSLQPVGGDWYQIVARHSGMCLDVQGAIAHDRAYIQQFPCKARNNANQSWQFRSMR